MRSLEVEPIRVVTLNPPEHFAAEAVSLRARIANGEWEGTIAECLTHVQSVTDGQIPLDKVFWQPARIVQSLIDSDVAGPDRVKLITLATLVALKIYTGVPAHRELEELGFGLRFFSLIDKVTAITYDEVTAKTTNTTLAKATGARINAKVPGEQVAILALCKGGLVSSLLAAAYLAQTSGADPIFYPIQCSVRKRNDAGLYLTDPVEAQHVVKIVAGRTAVACDEDSVTGQTIAAAVGDLTQRLPVGTQILGIAGEDCRSNSERTAQGVWWERVVLLAGQAAIIPYGQSAAHIHNLAH